MNMIDILKERDQLIDLRSDTVTMPTQQMRAAMAAAPVGDGGRTDLIFKGEDPTVTELEALAAGLLKKDDALFFPTGSCANHAALMSVAGRGDRVLVESNAHIYIHEKYDFMDKGGGMVPVCYHLDEQYLIDPNEIERLVAGGENKALCLENTHNYSSGTCLTVDNIRRVCAIAHDKGMHVHMDGARVFNAAAALGVAPWQVAEHVDSVMFCVSKGLGAPVGSLLAGSSAFIREAAVSRKLIGGSMRQAGIIAAAGIMALKNNVARLAEDQENARILAALIGGNPKLRYDPAAIQTNMVYADVTPAGLNAAQVTAALAQRGLLVAKMTDSEIRMVTSLNVNRQQVERAAEIINRYFEELPDAPTECWKEAAVRQLSSVPLVKR